jgi:hypothetical protein
MVIQINNDTAENRDAYQKLGRETQITDLAFSQKGRMTQWKRTRRKGTERLA